MYVGHPKSGDVSLSMKNSKLGRKHHTDIQCVNDLSFQITRGTAVYRVPLTVQMAVIVVSKSVNTLLHILTSEY